MRSAFASQLLAILVLVFGGFTYVNAQTSEIVRVQINYEKRAPKSRITVRFLELLEDARCPADVNCVWAGNARIKIRISKNGRSKDAELDTNLAATQTTGFDGFHIKLTRLTPVPRTNIRINRNGYVGTFEVTKRPPW